MNPRLHPGPKRCPPLPPLPNACVRSEVDVRDIIAYDMTKPPHPRRILRIDFMMVII